MDDRCVDGFAPFSSLATRETFLDISDNVAMAPGPGYYDPKPSKPRKAITGIGTMNSRVMYNYCVRQPHLFSHSFSLQRRNVFQRRALSRQAQEHTM